jgi:glyceraldehyde-3-phosphate dehydrogenase/erythrose-4-phosphate dehydrogenase
MKRVQAWDNEGKDIVVDEGTGTAAPKAEKTAAPKKGSQKRVAQSSEHPGGIAEEAKGV